MEFAHIIEIAILIFLLIDVILLCVLLAMEVMNKKR